MLYEVITDLAPAPGPRTTTTREVVPTEEPFSGFVFKIQANMDPMHRDRIAFLRVCSGKFTRGMKVRHHRIGKEISLANRITSYNVCYTKLLRVYPLGLGIWLSFTDARIGSPGHFVGLENYEWHLAGRGRARAGRRRQIDQGVEQFFDAEVVDSTAEKNRRLVPLQVLVQFKRIGRPFQQFDVGSQLIGLTAEA